MDKYYLNPQNSVLMIVDLQEKLFPVMPNQARLLKNNQLLLALARVMGIPVYITEQYVKGLGETVKQLDFTGLNIQRLPKMTFSAAVPELTSWLEQAGRSHIIVAGMETHVCVYQTVRELLRLGYHCHVVEDAVDSRFALNYQNALRLLGDMGAVITNTETIIFDMLHIAGTPQFKEIAPLLR